MIKRNFRYFFYFIIGAGIIMASILPLLRSDYIFTHDSNLYPTLLYEFDVGIKEGIFLPRWSPDFWLGLGSPIFNFVQPLFFYLAEIFHVIGLTLVNSVKITIIAGAIVGFVSMYLLGKLFWKNSGGIIAATIFTFFPYRLALIYIRGAYAEFFAFSLIPLIIYFFLIYLRSKNKIFFLFSALFFSFLILMHNIATIFFLPFFIIFIIFLNIKNLKLTILALFFLIILSFSMSAFFISPAFFEMKYISSDILTSEKFDIHKNFLNIDDLLLFRWENDKFSQLGAISLVILIVSVYILVFKKESLDNLSKKIIVFSLSVSLVFIFMMLPVSAFFWENFPIIKYIQFPWRLLSFLAILFGLLGAGVLLNFEFLRILFKKIPNNYFLIPLFLVVIILTYIAYTQPPNGYLSVTDDESYHPSRQIFEDKKNILTSYNNGNIEKKANFLFSYAAFPCFIPSEINCYKLIKEFTSNLSDLLLYVPENQQIRLVKKAVLIEGAAEIKIEKNNSNSYVIKILADQKSKIQINQFWFPGWRAYLDGSEIVINHDNPMQFMIFAIPVGYHELKISFTNTPIRTVSEIVSFIAWVIWVILFFYWLILKKLIDKNPYENFNPNV